VKQTIYFGHHTALKTTELCDPMKLEVSKGCVIPNHFYWRSRELTDGRKRCKKGYDVALPTKDYSRIELSYFWIYLNQGKYFFLLEHVIHRIDTNLSVVFGLTFLSCVIHIITVSLIHLFIHFSYSVIPCSRSQGITDSQT